MHDTVIKLLDEVKKLWMATPSLSASANWPCDLVASNSVPNAASAADKIFGMTPAGKQRDITRDAVQQVIFQVNWQSIYTKLEVGWHFRDNYTHFELIGPTRHFQSERCCAFIGF